MEYYSNIVLKGGKEIRNLKISSLVDADILGVIRTVFNTGATEVKDIECCYDGTNWFSLRGYKAQNTYEEIGGNIPILEGLSSDGKSYKFRVLKAGGEAGSEALTITNSGGIITIDLSNSFKDRIDDIEDVLSGKVDKELKTGSQSVYKVLSDNNFTDYLLAKLGTIQIKKDVPGGKYYLVFNDGTDDIQLGVDIPLDSVIDSGSVKVCTVVNEPVTGYKVGDKYIDFTIANSNEHVYILVSDLVDTMEGFDGTEIKTTVTGNTIKAELKDYSISIARLEKIVLGTITKTSDLISETTEYTIKEAIILLACNIKDLYDRKADKVLSVLNPTADSNQITADSYELVTILQKALNNIKYLFDNKANSDHSHEGVYLKPTDVIDNISDSSTTKPLSANQGKVLGGLINERLKGVKVDGAELTPDANKVVSIPTMVGATASVDGEVGLVPKPLIGQQSLFLKADGTYGTPNADVVASASYIGGNPPVSTGATFQNDDNDNIIITLASAYASQTAFPTAVDIVQVIRNGQTLALGTDADFTINQAGGNIITLLGYTLYSDDVILVRYKTSIGIYGSIYQSSLEASIEATAYANTAAQRAEEAAIDAENIADSKIDKTAIKQELGDSETDIMSQKAVTDEISTIEADIIANTNDIRTLENTLNSANINQETTATVTGVDIVSLPKTAANTGMSVQLFGQSAENLVVNGDFRNGLSGWISDLGYSLSISNGNLIATVTSLNANSRIGTVSTNFPNTTDKYYILHLLKAKYANVTQYSFRGSGLTNTVASQIVINEYAKISLITTATSAGAGILYIYHSTASNYQIGDMIELGKVRLINLTATFGAGNEPDLATCDAMFSDYFEGVKSVVPTGRVRSVDKNGLNPTVLYLTAPELRSNGAVKDEIRKGTNGYELVKRVGVGSLGANGISGGDFEGGLIGLKTVDGDEISTWTLNTTNPISGTKDGLLSVTNGGTNGVRPGIRINTSIIAGKYYRYTFSYKVNSGTCIFSGTFAGGGGLIGAPVFINETFLGSGIYYANFLATSTMNTIRPTFDGRNPFNVQIDNISIKEIIPEEGAIATGSTFTELSDGTVLYTLATPVISPISYGGILNSSESGTVYHEPVIADAGVYSTNLTVQLTDYPITSFESIRKYANGTYTELNTATAIIASDGLSFTHPDLVSGDLVMFTYAYNKESIGRSITLTHYDSRFVQADTANGKVYKIIPVITNGVVSWTAVEV